MIRRWFRPLLAVALLVTLPLPAWPVIVETTTGAKIKGHLVRQSPTIVVVRFDGSDIEETIPRSRIKKLHRVVDEGRLESLNKELPQRYRDYADELARHREDPEARDMALRLYLISAWLDRDKFGQSSLLKMVDLARTPAEARAFRAMAFLEDPLRDVQSLQGKGAKLVDDGSFEQFLKALRLFRRGKTNLALETAQGKGVSDYFALVPGLISYKDFIRLCQEHPECKCKTGRAFCTTCKGKGLLTCKTCKGKGFVDCELCQGKARPLKVSEDQLQAIVRLELMVESAAKLKLGSAQEIGWTDTLRQMMIGPAPVLSLENITEFDPRKCHYRAGKWILP